MASINKSMLQRTVDSPDSNCQVQQQLYASMPKYVLRMVGEDASLGWYANVNPFVVFLCVNFVTSFMKKRKAIFIDIYFLLLCR